MCTPAEVQHGISRGVFANSAHAHRVCGVSVQLHGNLTVAGRHGRAQERRALCPVLASDTYRWATRLPTGSGQAAAQGVVRRRDCVRPAGRLLVPDIVSRVYTEVTYNIRLAADTTLVVCFEQIRLCGSLFWPHVSGIILWITPSR